MAAEKRSQANTQSIVDQDAAITAYLDGLLRDPDEEALVEPSRARKTPGLKVIAPEPSEPVPADLDTDMVHAEAPAPVPDSIAGGEEPGVQEHGPAEEHSVDQSAASGADEPPAPVAESSPDEQPRVDEAAAGAPEASMAEDDTTAQAAGAGEPALEDDTAGAPAEAGDQSTQSEDAQQVTAEVAAVSSEPEPEVEPEPWAWLRIGGMTVAIPAEAVVSRHADAALDPVPGAPAQVAGALSVDGRPRLILSLANVTGARPRGEATEVLLLGPGGLWGVVGEPLDQPPALDAEAVQWRSEPQRAERRGWLAGTLPAAGVAVLDVAGLRAALKGSR